jgi:long-chain acyl-CoA synthetase
MDNSQLPLQRIYHWETTRPYDVYLSQPMGGEVMRDYTWSQAVGEARRVAAYLKSFGWEPGTRIGILSKNCAWWILSDFAIWMAGYVSVPLYPTLAATTVRQILDHSDCKACFVGKLDDWQAMKPGVPAHVRCISYPLSPPNDFPTWDELVAKTPPLAESPVRPADELCTIIYTSGTTGMPKGVMHAFRAFAAAPASLNGFFSMTPQDRMLSYLPLSHVAERLMVEAGSIHVGFRVYFGESLETFARDLRRARPTFFFSVPRLWTKFQQGVLAKMPKAKLDRLLRIPIVGRATKRKILEGLGLDQARVAGGGAAPMPPALISWFRELGLELLEGYGMTENFGCSHASRPDRGRIGYVGEPYPDADHRLAEDGEVLVRTPWNMLGYYREPELTAAALGADGWLRTGDRGEIDEHNRLRITGRAKEIFKTSKGKYVAPSPIESKLSSFPGIEACCVAGANYGQPFAMALLSPDVAAKAADPAARAALTQSLSAHLKSINDTLDPHEQLDFITVIKEPWTVESGFITPTLKVKRNEVEKAYAPHFDAWLAQKTPVVWD